MTVTTEDGNRQNLFAVEPKMYITEKDMAEHEQETYAQRAERLNGRLAMLGFVIAVGTYITTGQILPGVFWNPNSTIPIQKDSVLYKNGVFPLFMPKNQLTKDELKCWVLKLKHNLYEEKITQYTSDPKTLANLYLNKVLEKINEFRY